MLHDKKIGFIGAGSMAEAILSGLLRKSEIERKNIIIVNRNDQDRLQTLANRYHLPEKSFQRKQIEHTDIVLLATKPKDLPEALMEWSSHLNDNQTVISVVAGISIQFIKSFLDADVTVIRAMPNTSSSVGHSATALCTENYTSDQEIEISKRIFSAIGTVLHVEESAMDAVTGLSGSGPAYFYYMVEAMELAGVEAGLTTENARKLTTQTILGAAHMLTQTEKPAEQLRKEVTSPNGTTMAGIDELNMGNFHQIVQQAVLRAKKRSQEIGRELNKQTT